MSVLPGTLYQCKKCKKVIGKINPKARESQNGRTNLIREDNNGPMSQPQGWCQFCKTEYCIEKEDIIHTGDLTPAEKTKLGKEIKSAIEKEKVANAPAIPKETIEEKNTEDTGPVISKKDAFLAKKQTKK